MPIPMCLMRSGLLLGVIPVLRSYIYILAKCFQEENSEDVNGKTQFLIPMLYHLLYSVCVSHDYFFLSI